MAADAAESHCIPGEGDAISKQMFAITVKIIEQTLQHSDPNQPVLTDQPFDGLEWLKARPSEIAQACALVNLNEGSGR